ncbi:MAG: glycosyltransferase family 2 protein [Thermoleophilia bacterium]
MTIPDLSVCVAVYRRHRSPNISTLAASLDAAVGDRSWELVVTLNGIGAAHAGVPAFARTVGFDDNRGVPIAWNAAAREATGRLLCIINDDVVLGPASLAMLADALDSHPGAGVVGPVGTIWDIAAAQHDSYVDTSALAPGHVARCDVLSGFLLMTHGDVFSAVGGFDEALTPCGFEEVDYCTAVRRVAGRDVLVVAGVPVEHRFAISSQRGLRRIGRFRRISYMGRTERLDTIAQRNRAHFLSKWGAH